MQKISFGSVTKVNAPISAARQIAAIANSPKNSGNKIEAAIKSIIQDTKEGSAIAYSFSPDGDGDSYIFSGKEAKEYVSKNRNFVYEEMDRIHEYYGNDDDLIDIEVKRVGEEFLSNIEEIISAKSEIPEISAQTNPNTDTISYIDIIA